MSNDFRSYRDNTSFIDDIKKKEKMFSIKHNMLNKVLNKELKVQNGH
jgi:hypothetical protein